MGTSLGAMRHATQSIVTISLAMLGLPACHHRTQTSLFFGCTPPTPRIGPVGHLELIRSDLRDSTLPLPLGRLVLLAQWSSDSLAKETDPVETAIAHLTGVSAHTDTATLTTGGSRGRLNAPLREGTYHLVIRQIGAVPLDTTVTVRQGYADTIHAYLQADGLTVCS